MKWNIPLYKIHWDQSDADAVLNVIRRGAHWTNGPEVAEFETTVADYVGRRHAVAFNSGTSALHALMLAHGIGAGDEVIVPSFTFISTANSVLFVGAKPVFADIEPETFALDAEDVRRKVTERTRAIVLVHYGGLPARDTEALKKLAHEKGVLLIEDAAESLGATMDGKKVGTFGHSAMFSFCGNKVITTGEGGMIVTDDSDVHRNLLLIRSHGRLEKENYFESSGSPDYVTLGYNFRMNSMTAALGVAQMKKLDDVIALRRKVAQTYDDEFARRGTPVRPPASGRPYFNVYQMYSLLFTDSESRRKAVARLNQAGIMSKVYFEPVHRTHFYKNIQNERSVLPVTEHTSERILTIPLYPHMSENEMQKVVNALHDAKS